MLRQFPAVSTPKSPEQTPYGICTATLLCQDAVTDKLLLLSTPLQLQFQSKQTAKRNSGRSIASREGFVQQD